MTESRRCGVDECANDYYCRGLCKTHYDRLRRRGDVHASTPTRDERFWAKVDRSDDCWIWLAGLTHNGYGRFTVDGKNVPAHRWSYERFVGPIPDGLVIDHLCRTPACVNPEHLEPVTQRENALRGVGPTAANAVKTHCAQGHEYTPENTYVYPSRGWRMCRRCHQQWDTARRARKREAAA